MANLSVPPEQLRWTADSNLVPESSTREGPGAPGLIGQARAREALRYALSSGGRNHNAFVRGPIGSGRRTLIRAVIEEFRPAADRLNDFCYVHNFTNPDRPRLIVLPGGQGRHFQGAMSKISLFVRDRLPEILENDPIRSRREARKEAAEREIRIKVMPMEKRLKADGLALMRVQSGPSSRVSIYPLVMGKPVSPEEYRNLVTQGQARDEERAEAMKRAEGWQSEVNKCAIEINQIWQQALQHIDQINATETARILGEMTADIARRFKAPGLDVFLREIIDDIVEKRVGRDTSHLADPTLLYGVNVLTSRSERTYAPVVWASQPSVANLFGTIDPAWMSSGRAITSFRGIRTGALLEADGGVLIIDAADVLAEPGSWRMLMRALRTGLAEVVPPELGWPYSAQSLKPEPIPIRVRVIMTGDAETFSQLMAEDREFPFLFKLLVDFDESLPRDRDGISGYTRFLAQLTRQTGLLPFDRSAMLAMIEQGARLAEEPGRLSTRFGDLADLAREAADLAAAEGMETVEREQVDQALRGRRDRASRDMARLLRAVSEDLVPLRSRGRADSRLNSVMALRCGTQPTALPLSIGCSLGPSESGRVLVDDAPADGLLILLCQLLKMDRPPRLLARIRSRMPGSADPGGLELARACCLIGALAHVPLRQDLAIIGDIDDGGLLVPARQINERIESFFELCRQGSLSGQHGVIIPRANLGALMLEREVVRACGNDMFQVLVVDSVVQALELVTGIRAGFWKEGRFPEDSVLGRARATLERFDPSA